ncbi:LppU/SCO3897 family protein [Mycobacteroides sp. PCS013]|uniref:LppU/SCO3897 family protein n=1 Tax=Mycobacteroides sp. PCS013 TaxID=3074106 RepID=UPI003C2F66F6
MTGPRDPYQQGPAGEWGAPEGSTQGYWQAPPPTAPYGYAPADYPDDSIRRLYDGVPQNYAVPPMYPGLPGQDPFGSQKKSRPWILIASIAGAVVVVLAVVLVVILNRDSAPRQSVSAPSTTVSYANPESPTAGGEPTYQTPTAQPPRTPMAPPQMPVPLPAPTGAPKAPGQVAVVGDCIALAAPSDYKAVACTDPKAAWRVIEVVPGGKCRQTYTGFTAGNFSYCIAPQLRIGSCYQTAVVMGSTVFVAADSCQAPKAFMVLFVIPGTKESSQCKGKPGVVHSFAFPDPPMAICTSEFAP